MSAKKSPAKPAKAKPVTNAATEKAVARAPAAKGEPIDKRTVRGAFVALLEREIAVVHAAAEDAAAGATHEENKPEHDKDMRSTEASYLARGQAERVQELAREVGVLQSMLLRAFGANDAIASSALVRVVIDADSKAVFFVAPVAGGMTATVDGIAIQAITPRSPVGAALLGKCLGDVAEVRTQQGVREYEIVSIE
jgi:transcription elongation GreA/GreB family factor